MSQFDDAMYCREQKAEAQACLLESVTAFPCNWGAWQVGGPLTVVHHLGASFVLLVISHQQHEVSVRVWH